MNRFVLFAFCSVFAFSCSKKDKTPADPKVSESPFAVHMPKVPKAYKKEFVPKIEAFYDKTWKRNHTNGAFLVAKNGEILFERYEGYSRLETKSEIRKDTPLHIASLSKVLTATVVLRLIDQGKLRLDQDVSTLLRPFPYEGVTVEMLLSHRSGIPYYAWFADDQKIWKHDEPLRNQDVLDLLNQHKFPLNFRSGKRFAYCNTNYVLLALIIEKVTGMDYAKAMKTLLFDPIGMTHTFVFDYDTDRDTVSQSYKGNRIRLAFDWTDATTGDKNIYSTPRDLLKFDIATYAPGFLSPELREKAWSGKSYESKGKRNYGYGMRIYEWEGGQKMLYHNGWWHGNTSSYITLKKDTVTIIGIANKYSTMPWQAWKLTPTFGDYPFKLGEEEGN